MTIVQQWSKHKVATVSIALATLEIVIVWGAVVIAIGTKQHATLLTIASFAWILGGLGSFTSAVASLVIDQKRQMGLLSLIISVVAFLICGLPMLV